MSAARSLRSLLAGFDVPVPDMTVSGIATDSRRVKSGDLFLACAGRATHGLAHLEQAIERGAAAVAWEPVSGSAAPAVAVPEFAVPQLGARIGEIAARFYGRPSERMFCVGVTGTDGKTSTAYLVAQLFDALRIPCAYIGTIGTGRVGALDPATHTTPDPVALQQRIAEMRDAGAQALAMEVSSHALDQDRIAGMHFDVAVLTNITRDHLDYHGSVEHYAASKRKLFERPELGTAILNRDDDHGAQWLAGLKRGTDAIVYGLDGASPRAGSWVIGRDLQLDADGLRLSLDTRWGRAELRSRLLGRFNAYNLMAAAAVALARDRALPAVVAALSAVHTVPGRAEGFHVRGRPLVVVDYAHTPGALRQILAAARAHARGRLICVFGCGGDRDRGKRPLMGAAAAELADTVIVTDDNPRSEDPRSIAAAIVDGIVEALRSKVCVIHDRAEAIRTAVMQGTADDVVVVAGKGHEQTQIVGSQTRTFSDRGFVAGLLDLALPEAAA